MSLQALRRWIARHPVAWVLGLALTLCGAQLAATAHEFSHLASAASAQAAPHGDVHVNATHDCPSCLMVAALGGAAPTSIAVLPIAPPSPLPVVARTEQSFVVRVALPYASRAPPSQPAFTA